MLCSTSSSSKIGGYLGSQQDKPFKGAMEYITFWNVALSPSDIARLSSSGVNGNEIGLVSYYTFDSGLLL
jgi:hypothetical protein